VVHSTVIGSILVGFDFLLPFLAVMLLFDFARKVSPGFRKQVYLVIISIMLTLIMTWLKMTVLDDFGIFIYVSVLYTPSAGILFYALFKYNFFSLSPIARDKVFEIIDQGILVMNNEGFIVDANAYAIDLIKKMGDFKNSPVGFKIEDIYDTFPTAQEMTQAYKEGKQEVKIARGMGEIYISLNYYPLYNNGRESIGSVLMISNITQQKLHELKLEERADRDPLTRLLNRNGFQNTYMHRRKKWYGNQTPISVFMMDLDNFKKINDTYGHTNGDKILCHFAQLLTGLLREEDIIGRIGGEEFSIILPHIRKETAFKIAERIRQKVAESQVVLSDNQMISYTVSIGITDNDANEKSLWDILKEADMALYQAKEMSRNCSVIYNPAKD
jgi:diguanylate cyclase (GGDEF)-like protein